MEFAQSNRVHVLFISKLHSQQFISHIIAVVVASRNIVSKPELPIFIFPPTLSTERNENKMIVKKFPDTDGCASRDTFKTRWGVTTNTITPKTHTRYEGHSYSAKGRTNVQLTLDIKHVHQASVQRIAQWTL